jgi:HNH endonuclease
VLSLCLFLFSFSG